jgi:hypothetical protein
VECKGPGSSNDQYILNESHTDIHRFLFVNLNIRYLCKQFTARDILTELDRLQTAQTTDKSMNDSMDPTYDRIMEAIRDQPMACASRATPDPRLPSYRPAGPDDQRTPDCRLPESRHELSLIHRICPTRRNWSIPALA